MYLIIFTFLYYLRYRRDIKFSLLEKGIFLGVATIPTLVHILHTYGLPGKTYSFSKAITTLMTLTDFRQFIFRVIYLVGGLNVIIFLFFLLFIFSLFFKNKEKLFDFKEFDWVVITWLISYSVFYFSFLGIAHVGNNYYLLPFMPPIILGAAKTFNLFFQNKKFRTLTIVATILLSLFTLFIIYDIQRPYKEAGLVISRLVDKDYEFYREGCPSVCYYAEQRCFTNHQFEFYESDKYQYLSIAGKNLEIIRNSPEQKKFLEENFRLIQKIHGKNNILSGTYVDYNRQSSEYIFVRKK